MSAARLASDGSEGGRTEAGGGPGGKTPSPKKDRSSAAKPRDTKMQLVVLEAGQFLLLP